MDDTDLWNDIGYAIHMIISGITLELHVDWIGSPLWVLAESPMITQLCCHNRSINYECQWCIQLSTTPSIPYRAGQHTVKLRLHRIAYAVEVMQYQCTWNIPAYHRRKANTLSDLPVIEQLKPKHAVSERSMTQADDKRSEVNFLICLSYYALLPEDGVMIYVGRVLVGRQFTLSRNCHIPRSW